MNDETPDPGNTQDDSRQSVPVSENVKSRSTWLRLFFMLVVMLLYSVSRAVVGIVVLLQFFWVLLTGETNARLGRLGRSLATYTYQIVQYLTFNTEDRPFPFDLDWPDGPPAGS